MWSAFYWAFTAPSQPFPIDGSQQDLTINVTYREFQDRVSIALTTKAERSSIYNRAAFQTQFV